MGQTRNQAVDRIADRILPRSRLSSNYRLLLIASPAVLRYCAVRVQGSRVWPFGVMWCHWSRHFFIGGPLEPSRCL